MAERLTDQTEYTGFPAVDDLLHMVDKDDTTGNAEGTSKKIKIQNLLKGRTFQLILGCLVYKYTTSSPTIGTIQTGDIVIWASDSTNSNRMVIGITKAIISSIPADFDDKAKFDKFIDTPSLL